MKGRADSIGRRALLCGVVAPAVAASFVVAASRFTPEYSQVSDTISNLGAQDRPGAEVMNAGLIALGLLMNGFAYGMWRAMGTGVAAGLTGLAWTVFGSGVVLAGVLQGDARTLGGPVTAEGTAHLVVALTSFAGLELGAIGFALKAYTIGAWRRFALVTFATVVVNFVLALAFLMGATEEFDGVLERVFYSAALLWIAAVALRLRKVELR